MLGIGRGSSASAQGELPVRAVGGIDLVGQIHPQFFDAVVANSQDVGGVELDLDRLGRVDVAERGRTDDCTGTGAAPGDINPWAWAAGEFDEVDRKAGVFAHSHQPVLVVVIGRDEAIVKARTIATAGSISFIIERGGEGARAVRA